MGHGNLRRYWRQLVCRVLGHVWDGVNHSVVSDYGTHLLCVRCDKHVSRYVSPTRIR